MTDELVEQVARAIHGVLSHSNILAYLDMPHETPNDIARAVIPLIYNAAIEDFAREISMTWLANSDTASSDWLDGMDAGLSRVRALAKT